MRRPVVAIHQPAYLPWFGLLEKIALCDRFIVLDTVQYNARAFQHRTLYSTTRGPQYLSLSVSSKGHQVQHTAIRDIALTDTAVAARHFETLRHRYGKRPGWSEVAADLQQVLSNASSRLIDLDVALIALTMKHFGIETELRVASDLEASGSKTDLMVSLTQSAGGGTYLSGAGAADYMQPVAFTAAGLDLAWQDFEHPVYPQSHGGAFQPGCFALEWIIEQPDRARPAFHDHVAAAAARIGLA